MRISLFLIVALLVNTAAIAGDSYQSYYERQQLEKEQQRNQEYPYESSTGTRYKYDLSKPSDQIRYEVDPRAQIRDSINVNPRIEIDRNLGQYGGGAE